MLVFADENMAFPREIFSGLGDVRLFHGRKLSPADLADAEVLMIRSITRVDEALLAGSRVRFVGTATIGTDHVDTAYLASRGIGFSSAPGCNAESVAQYIAAALLFAAGRLGRSLSDSSIGIIGVGNCGRRVERIARALGLRVFLNDPPLARRTGDPKYRPMEELMDCDFLTLHVPLAREGEDATVGLINGPLMDRLKSTAVIINASRFYVLDEAALAQRLGEGRLGGAILDAWEDEPRINAGLHSRLILGTPHVAGYSFDGKVTGSRMVYEAACKFLERIPETPEVAMPGAVLPAMRLSCVGRGFDSVAAELILSAYPIWRDSFDLARALAATSAAPARVGEAFDSLRKLYPLRREFAATRVTLESAPSDWIDRFKTVGFTVEQV